MRSQAYALKNDYTNAFSDIKKAIELEPNSVKYKLKSAETYWAAGGFSDKFVAAGAYKEALAILNNLIHKKENYEKPPQRRVGDDETAPPVDTDFIAQFDALRSQIYYARGNVNLALSEFESAISDYSKALDANPNFRDALLRRSQAYIKIGNSEEADADQKRAAALVSPVGNEKAGPSPTPLAAN